MNDSFDVKNSGKSHPIVHRRDGGSFDQSVYHHHPSSLRCGALQSLGRGSPQFNHLVRLLFDHGWCMIYLCLHVYAFLRPYFAVYWSKYFIIRPPRSRMHSTSSASGCTRSTPWTKCFSSRCTLSWCWPGLWAWAVTRQPRRLLDPRS